jgi:Na+/H+-dicarboxylate symporter/ABC-type amino acid transport substrate-binding protein
MRRLSVGWQVLVAVLLGICVGLFFGPLCRILKPVGDTFTMLLQMVVLPYICFSLIHGLGSISPKMGKRLFQCGWPYLVGLWALMFVFIFGLGILIPKPAVALISSPSSEAVSLSKTFLSFLIPENLFYDLANNVVPAVAIFGIIMGCALMHNQTKEPLCGLLERLNQAFEKILGWLADVAPIGAFAHIAFAVGTVRFEDLDKLSFYAVSFMLLAVFVTGWALPWLIAALTPLSFKEVLYGFRRVCLLPFVTGLPTIALPFINRYLKKLSEHQVAHEKKLHEMAQSVMPIAYSFGQIGNAMILFFFWFLSFYYRQPLIGPEKGLLSLLTIPLLVGSSATSINAVTFLIGVLHFPPDSVSLFSETLGVTINFQVLMSIAGVLTLILLTLFKYYDLLHIQWGKLWLRLSVVLGVFGALLWIAKENIHLDDKYRNLYQSLSIEAVINHPVATTDKPLIEPVSNEDPLQRILRTGVLRIGYEADNPPYCYLNAEGKLVGYDIALAYLLARDLDCKLEFVKYNINHLEEELSEGKYDIGMAGILMIEQRLAKMDFTYPYTEQDNVLVIPHDKKALFLNLERATQNPDLVIGATGGYSYVVQRHFPLAKEINTSNMEHLEELFEEKHADAWIWSRTPAFIWCLSHPDYAIVDYADLIGKRYFSYPVRKDSPDFVSFLNRWLMLKEESGEKNDMYNYWIRGLPPKQEKPRWSVLRNVLNVNW